MISPGFPVEMAFFTRGLAAVGATVIGLGDQPEHDLPGEARAAVTHHVHVPSLADTEHVVRVVYELARRVSIERVECLWEPYMMLAGRLREELGLPGLTQAQTVPFRDKELMKQVLDYAGLRTPRHESTETVAGVWAAVERIGYPVIVKPIDGAGSADTYRVEDAEQMNDVLPMIRHVPRASVKEFVEAEEFTYDTICADGKILFENVCWYRPRPLLARSHEWISPMTVALRDLDVAHLDAGRVMGAAVIEALGFRDGFTHMEWYRKADGEVVFGEIGARPPGGRTVDLMNFVCDADLFTGWAEAVVHGRISQDLSRKYNAASIFKRAQGVGRITGYGGLDELLAEHGPSVTVVELLPVGAPRRDWRATLISDGTVVVRAESLHRLISVADDFVGRLQLYAG
ncbi:MAG: ATP-grasp domain-containing protein [Geodermatophilaceae bacterium]|nr:ATP-grasp domain-containing protein [Geodermatophilaceae bacterium]